MEQIMRKYLKEMESLEKIDRDKVGDKVWGKIINCEWKKNTDETIKYIKEHFPLILKDVEEVINDESNFKEKKKKIRSINKSNDKLQKIKKKLLNHPKKVKDLLKEIDALNLNDKDFNKETEGVQLIQKEVKTNTFKNGLPKISILEKYKEKLILIRLIYRIKRFVLHFKDEFLIDKEGGLKSEHKVLKLMDDLLWKIPELKAKKTEQRLQCKCKEYKKTNKNKIQMDHVVDRSAVENLLMILESKKPEIIKHKIDEITPYLFGCSIPKMAHDKIELNDNIERLLENPFMMYLNDKNGKKIKDINNWKNLKPQKGEHGVKDTELGFYLHDIEHPFNPYAQKGTNEYYKHHEFIESILETHTIELFGTGIKYTWSINNKKWEEYK